MSSKSAARKEQSENSFPLFFSSPYPLTLERHKEAGIKKSESYGFSRNTNSIPLAIAEIPEAAKCYPVAFTEGEFVTPVAIVGLEHTNLFLDKDGNWQANAYVPAYARKYPFLFMEVPEKNEFVLCIDEKAPHFQEKAGADSIKIYEGEEPSKFTKDALTFCSAFQEQFLATQDLCSKLKGLDLLMSSQSNAELPSGKNIRLSGFQLIDIEKFKNLKDEDVLALHKSGYLALINYVIQSASNWQHLVRHIG